MITGSMLSTTWIVFEIVEVLPLASTAVATTVTLPKSEQVTEAGLILTVGVAVQLSTVEDTILATSTVPAPFASKAIT